MHTLGSLVLALQVQGGAAVPSASSSVIDLVRQTGPVNQAVLAVLAILSVVSWAIILQKTWAYRAVMRDSAAFLDVFRRSRGFSDVRAACAGLPASPLAGVFQAGYAELTAQVSDGGTAHPAAAVDRPMLKSLSAVDRALLRAATAEMNKLERKVTFLATIASAAPFIGLFGTVWGIMTAFNEIGVTGSTNLATVGPGIAEALVATAAGLFAAIPAVFFYNHFTTTVKALGTELDDFALEFLNLAERHFT